MKRSTYRSLGATEKLFWLLDQTSQVHFVIAAEMSSIIEPRILQAALSQVQLSHPLLSAKIVHNGFGHPYFEHVRSATIPLTVVNDMSARALQNEMSKELATPFDWSQAPLIRCKLINTAVNPVLLFAVHHAVSDGISMTYVISDLLLALAGQKMQPSKLPRSIDQLLGLEIFDYNLPDNSSIETENPITRRKEPEPEIQLTSLSPGLTNSLLSECRTEQTTIQGALYAAAISAARQSAFPWNNEPVKVIIPVSVRNAITTERSSALYINSKALLHENTNDLSFWELARFVKSELQDVKRPETISSNAIVTRDRIFNGAPVTKLADALQSGVKREMMISNIGLIPSDPGLEEITIRRIWGPLALSGTVNEITLGAATVNDQLCLSTATRVRSTGFLKKLISKLEEVCGKYQSENLQKAAIS